MWHKSNEKGTRSVERDGRLFSFLFFFFSERHDSKKEKRKSENKLMRHEPSDSNRRREVSAVVLTEGKLRDFEPTCFSTVAHLLPLTHTHMHTHTQASSPAISCPPHQFPLTGWNVRVSHAEKSLLANSMCFLSCGLHKCGTPTGCSIFTQTKCQ